MVVRGYYGNWFRLSCNVGHILIILKLDLLSRGQGFQTQERLQSYPSGR